jgi:hypothetical protein
MKNEEERMGFSEQQSDSVEALIPEFVEMLRKPITVDENGYAFDEETKKPLGKMFGEYKSNYPVYIAQDEIYAHWVKCSCGYEANSPFGKFCGGCGHPINLPDFVREKFGSYWEFTFEDSQWFAIKGGKKIALQPEINGVFEI